ncbi:unnamed protein product, partial [Medioppia subpectinata]
MSLIESKESVYYARIGRFIQHHNLSNIKKSGLIEHWTQMLYLKLFNVNIDRSEYNAHTFASDQFEMSQLENY